MLPVWIVLKISGTNIAICAKYGYLYKATKSYLAVKEKKKLIEAQDLLGNITTEAKGYLEPVIGSKEYRNEYQKKFATERDKQLTIL